MGLVCEELGLEPQTDDGAGIGQRGAAVVGKGDGDGMWEPSQPFGEGLGGAQHHYSGCFRLL